MKELYTFIGITFIGFLGTAQTVTIPDPNFKARLLQASPTIGIASTNDIDDLGQVASYTSIDTNNDGEIQLSEAQAIRYLDIRESNISNLEGINSFSNLTLLTISRNQITNFNLNPSSNLKRLHTSENPIGTLDATIFPNLITLDCGFNQLTSLTVNGMPHLREFGCNANQLTSLDISNMPSLIGFECSSNLLSSINISGSVNIAGMVLNDNDFTVLDFSGLINLINLEIYNCSTLTLLNVKNGRHVELELGGDPNLRYICVDDAEVEYVRWYLEYKNMTFCNVNTYCSFAPGGSFLSVNGNNRIDYDTNGCDGNDSPYPNLKLDFTDGTSSGSIYSNANGQYALNLLPGTYTLTLVIENPSYFNVSPANIQVTFPGEASSVTHNFCIVPNGVHQDVEVWVVPLTPARPGFDSKYRIYYKNKGNVLVSGNVTFTFEDYYMDYIIAFPAPENLSFNNLSWNYINLLPYETRQIDVTFNVNSTMETPAVNNGDLLKFGTAIFPNSSDANPEDNFNYLRQIVVGSFDPNNKTCLEGAVVAPELAGEFVHYLIRFENTGTFAAENVVVKDMIDTAKFDISTLVPLSGSHSYVTKISNTNKVEFLFENINLPFDDANNDGYIVFKIKTKPTLVVGDTFSNSASIYFDYNFPIITNPATTTIQLLGSPDFDFNSRFSLSPVPTGNVLSISNKQNVHISSISIYNTLGQLILVNTNPEKDIDVSALKLGTYFIKIVSDKGTANSKFIKE